MTRHLLDNTNIANVHFTGDVSFDSTWGIRFGCSSAITITGVRWYRDTTNVNRDLHGLRLYDASDALLWSTLVQVDTHTVGWQLTQLPTPVELPAGGPYKVCFDFPGGHVWNFFNRADVGAPASPLLLDDNAETFRFGSYGVPDTARNINVPAVDIELDGPSGGPSGGGGTGTTADLAAWLSNDAAINAHQGDGTPWQTNQLATGGSGFVAIKGVADTIATSVGSGLRTAVTTLTTNLATANAALVHAATTWSDALATALQNMSDDFASFGASKPAQGGGDFGTGTFPSNVGTLVWTLLDETDFAGEIAWAQPADVYVLTITERPFRLPLNLTAGVHTLYRCGWWCPLNGSFGRQRSYIDFEDNHLAIGAERMPGILIQLQPGGEGHLQAWALT